MLINALDYPNLHEAILAAEPGDRIYVPGVKRWEAPLSLGWVIAKSLEIFGDGVGTPGQPDGTTFVPSGSGSGDNVFTITTEVGEVGSVYLHDFKITKAAGGSDGANGIRCVTPNFDLGSLRLERITVLSRKNHGFLIDGTGSGRLRSVEMTSCGAVLNDGLGLFLKNVEHVRIVNSFFNSNKMGGLYSEASSIAMYVSGLEQNGYDAAAGQGQLQFKSCSIARLDACHFEKFDKVNMVAVPHPIACDIVDGGGAIIIGGCYFTLESTSTFGTSVRMQGAVAGPVDLLPNRHTRVTTLAEVAANSTTGVTLPQFDDGANGTPTGLSGDLQLPSQPLVGMAGCPSLRRVGVAAANFRELRGLLVPSGATPPTTNVQDGMLFYDTSQTALLVRVSSAWKRVKTT